MGVGARIKKRRTELKMSQAELAKLTGYADKTAISKIEHELSDLTQSKIVSFAKALDTTVEYLMGWEEKQKNVIRVYHSQELFSGAGHRHFPRPKPRPQEEILLMDNFSKLNDEGKKKVLEYMSDLLEMDKYKKDPDHV